MINLMQLLQMGPMINQFRQNPMQFLANQGISIPQEYMNSPESAAKYLMQNSNMNQAQINQIMNLASQYQQQMGNMNQAQINQIMNLASQYQQQMGNGAPQPPTNQPQIPGFGFGWPFGRR